MVDFVVPDMGLIISFLAIVTAVYTTTTKKVTKKWSGISLMLAVIAIALAFFVKNPDPTPAVFLFAVSSFPTFIYSLYKSSTRR